MNRFVTLFIVCVCLHASTSLHAQGSDPHTRTLTWALKVQAYQPLSWLAEPLNGERDFRFTPRFWTGEVELGFSERSAVQVSVGVRRYRLDGLNEKGNPISDHRDGIKLTLAYRNYLMTERWGRDEGLYISPFTRWCKGFRKYDFGAVWKGEITTPTISAGVNVGWQFRVKDHLLIDLLAGPEIGCQTPSSPFIEYVYGDNTTTFDYLGYVEIWGKGGVNSKFVGLGLIAALSIGWRFQPLPSK